MCVLPLKIIIFSYVFHLFFIFTFFQVGLPFTNLLYIAYANILIHFIYNKVILTNNPFLNNNLNVCSR